MLTQSASGPIGGALSHDLGRRVLPRLNISALALGLPRLKVLFLLAEVGLFGFSPLVDPAQSCFDRSASGLAGAGGLALLVLIAAFGALGTLGRLVGSRANGSVEPTARRSGVSG